jgi:hypothetical protein
MADWDTTRLANSSCMTLIEYARVLEAIPPQDFDLLHLFPGGPHFASQTSTCRIDAVVDQKGRSKYHVQALETMSTTMSPTLTDLFSRLGADASKYPIIHAHDSDHSHASATHSSDGSTPGASASELEISKEVFRKVYAGDIATLKRAQS